MGWPLLWLLEPLEIACEMNEMGLGTYRRVRRALGFSVRRARHRAGLCRIQVLVVCCIRSGVWWVCNVFGRREFICQEKPSVGGVLYSTVHTVAVVN